MLLPNMGPSSIFTLLACSFMFVACNDKSFTQPTNVNNVTRERIFLRELTTGTKYERKKFPQPAIDTGNLVSFDYEYFGEKRHVMAGLNSERTVTSYKILNIANLNELRAELEAKLTTNNGTEVKFKCDFERVSWGGIDWKYETCIIYSGNQRLKTRDGRQLTPKPSNVDYATWESMKTNELVLEEDVGLSKAESDRLEKEKKEVLDKKAGAKKQI